MSARLVRAGKLGKVTGPEGECAERSLRSARRAAGLSFTPIRGDVWTGTFTQLSLCVSVSTASLFP